MTKSLPVPWYFQIRSSVTLEVLRHLVHNADRPALTAGEPPDPGVSSEPDHLASGQFPRPPHRLRGCIRERDLASEVPREFSVPDGPTGGQPSEQASVEQRPYLVEQAGVDHRSDARLDTTGQDVPWNVDPRGPNAFIRVALPSHRVARERAPGDRGHLECPNRPSDVARLDPGGGGRIELRKALVQAIRSENLGLGHVHQVMRDPRSLRRGRLGRPNVHPPVHEHRVHRDDLGPQPPREGQGGLALSGGGRSNEREERLRAGHQRAAAGSRDEPAAADPLAPTTSPARWCGWAAAIRTSRNVPGAIVPGTWTTLLVRVRPWTPPFRPIPSTRTSNVRPIVSRIRSSEIDSCTWTSRSNRSWTTSLGIWFGIVAASVPGRGEYWNVYAWSNRAAPTTSSVPRKSSSVSPGKPTMMSVVTATPWMASRIRFSHERYRSLR